MALINCRIIIIIVIIIIIIITVCRVFQTRTLKHFRQYYMKLTLNGFKHFDFLLLGIPHPPWPLLISDVGLELEGTLINCSLL